MLYVPLEVILSKYYGESERLLGKVFSLANELPNGAIIFLDEVIDVINALCQPLKYASKCCCDTSATNNIFIFCILFVFYIL